MSAYWLELGVRAEREAAEAVSAIMAEYAYGGGVAIDEDITPSPEGDGYVYNLGKPILVKAYLPLDDEAGAVVERLRAALDHLSFLRPIEPLIVRRLAEEDWANTWKEHYHVLHIGRRLVIVPTWREYTAQSLEAVIYLDPGMAFGTGLHPTTRGCLERLEDVIRPGQQVLDVGTGSGILALAAARLGAERILALEIDPVAVQAASANVDLNGLGHVITVTEGSLPPAGDRRFDVVVANIIARIIADLAVPLAESLHPGGVLITSGIIAERQEMVLGRLADAGLTLSRQDADGDWITLTLTKPS